MLFVKLLCLKLLSATLQNLVVLVAHQPILESLRAGDLAMVLLTSIFEKELLAVITVVIIIRHDGEG